MSARKISSLESDVRLIAQRLDIIETNHLAHLREDVKSLNQKIWVIVILVIAQLFGLVFTLIS